MRSGRGGIRNPVLGALRRTKRALRVRALVARWRGDAKLRTSAAELRTERSRVFPRPAPLLSATVRLSRALRFRGPLGPHQLAHVRNPPVPELRPRIHRPVASSAGSARGVAVRELVGPVLRARGQGGGIGRAAK